MGVLQRMIRLATTLRLLAPILLFAGACGGEPEDGAAETRTDASEPDAAEDGSLALLDSHAVNRRLDGLIAKFDAAEAGWDTEVFQDRAGGQLKRLGKLLEHGSVRASDAEGLIADGFRCDALLPDDLDTIHASADLTVRRVVRPGSWEPRLEHRGADGFAAALHPLARTLVDHAEPHTKFKIYGVKLEEARATTSVLFETYGTGPVNHVARWTCRWHLEPGDATPLLSSITLGSHMELKRESGTAMFSDCTESVLGGNESFVERIQPGVNHWRGRIDGTIRGSTMLGHLGLALGDVNGDGLDDVFVNQVGGLPNQLFVQNADGTATDVTDRSGVGYLNNGHGALFVDLDNDGDQDLVFPMETQSREVIAFLENDGSGRFSEAATVGGGVDSYSLAAADYDGDGDLDIYFCRYARIESGIPDPYHDANNGPPNVLLRNDGDWTFTDVADEVGLGENNSRFSFAAAWEDYDNDGDVDLYVANDFGRNNLYRNDGGRFTDVAAEAGVEDLSAGMAVTWGDYDGDGWMDLYVSNMYSSAGHRVTYQRRFPVAENEDVLADFQRHAKGNTLFRNMGDGTFRDVSFECGVTMGRWAWGSKFADVDNDGYEDLLTVNGFVTNELSDDL